VRLHDGTTHHIALVEGDAAYAELFRRLQTRPRRRNPDDFDNDWDKFEYLKGRAYRSARKLLGLPAAPDIAILASMVSKLRSASQIWLGEKHPISAVVITSPDLLQLEDEVLGDVLDYLKLRNLLLQPYPGAQDYLDATSAALIGYGSGLCRNYLDAYDCEKEEWYMPDTRTLFLDFNNASLSGNIRSGRNIHDLFKEEGGFIDPELGHGNSGMPLVNEVSVNACGGASDFWYDVSTKIRKLVESQERSGFPRISQLILTGTFASDACFRYAIRDALSGLVSEIAMPVVDRPSNSTTAEEEWKTLFEFATARGAAEMAKRRQEGPTLCKQTDACRKRREGTYATSFRQQ
jgi:hypothetical protein